MPLRDESNHGRLSSGWRPNVNVGAMRSLRRVVCLASVGIWIACSVNQSGLTDGDVPPDAGVGTAGSGGAASAGRGGGGGTGGGVLAGSGGSGGSVGSSGGAGPAGSGGGAAGTGATAGSSATAGTTGGAGAGGTTGAGGTGGANATAGRGGSTGLAGTGGSAGSGAVGGTTGAAGSGATAGTVGSAGTGGTAGAGGTTGAGGRAGTSGNAGRGGTAGAGRGGMTGRGGSGGNPCASYPMAKSFVTPTDNRVHCYWARSSAQTWSEASQSCMLQNGHLVTILSAEENAFVVSIAQFSTSFMDTWIGATDGKAGGDRTGAGTYRWVTNETWGFTSWAQGQPDGFCDPCSAGQTCTCDHRATLVSDGTWTDMWSDNSRSSVCEATPN